jgi:hypothetical protein
VSLVGKAATLLSQQGHEGGGDSRHDSKLIIMVKFKYESTLVCEESEVMHLEVK